jgi:uncharacterized protein YjbI with pentapeptide repeats
MAIGALLFNASQKKTEFEIARERLYVEALQFYLDKMGQLLLKEDLLGTKDDPEAKVRKIAQVQTVTTLRKLDTRRQDIVKQFVCDAGLKDFLLVGAKMNSIDMHKAALIMVNLSGAILVNANLSGTALILTNLSRAYLMGANLNGASLISTNLNGADLSEVDLTSAMLSEADLSGATVTPEQLSQAKSLEGAIMPDGSVHE